MQIKLSSKSAYHKLAKIYHPDKSNSAESEEKFKIIKEAYATLIDEDKRRLHDIKEHSCVDEIHFTFLTKENGQFVAHEDKYYVELMSDLSNMKEARIYSMNPLY